MFVSDADVDLAAFQHGGLLATKSLAQFHVHVWKAFSVSRQETRQNTFDRVRRGGHLQYPPISAPEQLDSLAKRDEVTQYAATIFEQVLADGGQDKAASNTIKEPEAELLLKLAADGSPKDIVVQASSRSAELDQAAVTVAKGLTFKTKDPANPVTQVVVPIEFLRDSLTTLPTKTCAEFNVDLGYFKATFPELETRKMPVVNMTVGSYVTYGIVGLSQDKALAYMKRVEAAAKGLVEACAKEPEASYTKTFTRLVKEAG